MGLKGLELIASDSLLMQSPFPGFRGFLLLRLADSFFFLILLQVSYWQLMLLLFHC